MSTSLLLYTLHFEQDCFVPNKKIRVLKSGTVPSIFPSFPRRTIPVEQSSTHDHPYLLPPAKGLKRKNNHLVEEISCLKKKIKLLKDSKQKLIKKCTPLSDVVRAIKDKKFVSPNVCEILEQESL